MKEYIYQIEDDESDESEVFIGWIRRHGKEFVRCRDCKAYLPETNTLASYCSIHGILGLPEDAYCYKAEER